MSEHRAVVRTPPDTVDDAHDFLASVWLERPDVEAGVRMVIETALSELVTNVIQNNPHRQVLCDVTIDIDAGSVRLETSDTGDEVDEGSWDLQMPDDTSEHGRGLALIRLMADRLDYSHDGTRNLWRVEKARP